MLTPNEFYAALKEKIDDGTITDMATIAVDERYNDVYYSKKLRLRLTKKQMRYIDEQLRLLSQIRLTVVKLIYMKLRDKVGILKASEDTLTKRWLSSAIKRGSKSAMSSIYYEVYTILTNNKTYYGIENLHHDALCELIQSSLNFVASAVARSHHIPKFNKLPYFSKMKEFKRLRPVYTMKLDKGRQAYRASAYDPNSTHIHLRLQKLGWVKVFTRKDKKTGIFKYLTLSDWMNANSIFIKKEDSHYYIILKYQMPGLNLKESKLADISGTARYKWATKTMSKPSWKVASTLRMHSEDAAHILSGYRDFSESDLLTGKDASYDEIKRRYRENLVTIVDTNADFVTLMGGYSDYDFNNVVRCMMELQQNKLQINQRWVRKYGITTLNARFNPKIQKLIRRLIDENSKLNQNRYQMTRMTKLDASKFDQRRLADYRRELESLKYLIHKRRQRKKRLYRKIRQIIKYAVHSIVANSFQFLPLKALIACEATHRYAKLPYDEPTETERIGYQIEDLSDIFTAEAVHFLHRHFWSKAQILQIAIYDAKDWIYEDIAEIRTVILNSKPISLEPIYDYIAENCKDNGNFGIAEVSAQNALLPSPNHIDSLKNYSRPYVAFYLYFIADQLLKHMSILRLMNTKGVDRLSSKDRQLWYPINNTLFNAPTDKFLLNRPIAHQYHTSESDLGLYSLNQHDRVMGRVSDELDYPTKYIEVNPNQLKKIERFKNRHAKKKID